MFAPYLICPKTGHKILLAPEVTIRCIARHPYTGKIHALPGFTDTHSFPASEDIGEPNPDRWEDISVSTELAVMVREPL